MKQVLRERMGRKSRPDKNLCRAGFRTVSEAPSGTICAVIGLTKTFAGEGLGMEKRIHKSAAGSVLTYEIRLPKGCDVHRMLLQLRQLEEEEPQLHIVWKESLGEIHAGHGRGAD